MDDQTEVLRFLESAEAHGPGITVRRVETHAAFVFLAGANAYKVKRAVRFPFLDFSTLDLRQKACLNEIAVNRANAPDLYLGVVPITRHAGRLAIGGDGEVVEWAVHLRRFDETQTLDRIATAGPLGKSLLTRLAERILEAHARAPVTTEPAAVDTFLIQASDTLRAISEGAAIFPREAAFHFQTEMETRLAALRPLLLARCATGEVRRCHGDLHLRNIALIAGEPVLFDAIEFDDTIATCDVLYDLGFLLMDLCHRGLAGDANRLLNRYVWGAAEPAVLVEGLRALPVFMALRAAVRTKVALDLAGLSSGHAAVQDEARDEARAYLDLASTLISPAPARLLVAVGGLSGTGKSTLAESLCPDLAPRPGAIHLRTDVERKRMLGCTLSNRLPPAAYGSDITERVYAQVRDLSARTLSAGFSAVVDAVHASPEERTAIEDVARTAGAQFLGLWLEGAPEVLRQRVAERRADASDATVEVVDRQLGYEIGPLGWHRLDATQPVAETCARALQLISDLMTGKGAM
ncbi:AAA family ATPase [Aquabacter spiritensis]|uniref:Aminoglycoside phosphotransferase domain-containing protein n=1 Tax=Aquabacter spiritensis TaxID=933073 RepID=A0A4R3LST2_9HYPH|nr:bifunctional aminoglycoside phosphotransferase/ATP-binding protein [Aquabacter spiritensis]TCT02906.1 hypothetical protein EDC64_11178 [Aquabacter spiritensis]